MATERQQQEQEAKVFNTWFEANKNSPTPIPVPAEFYSFKYINLPPSGVVAGGSLYSSPTDYQNKINPSQYDQQLQRTLQSQNQQQNVGNLSKQALDAMYAKGYVLNPNADLNNPQTIAEFTKIAESEIDPYYRSQFKIAREQFLRSSGYSTDQLNQYEGELQRKYGQQVRDLQSNLAESGFAQSGKRVLGEQTLAQDTEGLLESKRTALGYDLGTQARTLAQNYGGVLGNTLPSSPSFTSSRVLPGVEQFQSGTSSPFYELSNDVYDNLIGKEEFNRRGAIASRTAELQGAQNTLNATRTI